eukprot:1154243-Pelagomonas_calceolata.AAC.9
MELIGYEAGLSPPLSLPLQGGGIVTTHTFTFPDLVCSRALVVAATSLRAPLLNGRLGLER